MKINLNFKYDVLYALNYAYENGNEPNRAIKLYDLVETSSFEDVGVINDLLLVLDPLTGFNKTVQNVVSALDDLKEQLVNEYYYML